MKRIQVVCVGRVRPPFDAAAREFASRIDRRLGFAATEVAAEPLQRGDDHARGQEAVRLRARIPRGAWRVAVDPAGRPPASSEAFAAWLGRRLADGRPLAFLVGGAAGLDPALVAECEETLSLGPLTMPHQLARVVLTEQLYRAVCILDGHPYPH